MSGYRIWTSINNQSNIIQTQTNQSNDWNKSIDQIDYRRDQTNPIKPIPHLEAKKNKYSQ